jgi:hypothetical protein
MCNFTDTYLTKFNLKLLKIDIKIRQEGQK